MKQIGKKSLIIGAILAAALMLVPITALADGVKASWVNAETGAAVDKLTLAAGEEVVIRLKSEVPDGKTLNAYSFIILTDETDVNVVKVAAAADAAILPANINKQNAGEVVVNGFSMNGVAGKADVSFVDVTLKGLKSGASKLAVLFTAYGASAADQFRPEKVEPIVVKVE